ncbi:uncharacterized protein LOC118344000 [Juglans regia]|uniref:Uncharacterized protein LOC118344000 n=1 Tax=Juglans regia TaxID=51240 RepID=A0A6P9DWV0_JUGRE|nr:uncharacterized protein LOC118344000 [Juglans regia]
MVSVLHVPLFDSNGSSSHTFLILQKPWKGRPLSNQQVVPSIINGGITALYFIMWGKGLKSCGPVRVLEDRNEVRTQANAFDIIERGKMRGGLVGLCHVDLSIGADANLLILCKSCALVLL